MTTGGVLHLALVGAGRIARSYGLAMRNLASVRIVGVVDVCPEAAAALAAEIGCQSHATLEGALASTRLDAVVVCTPPATHADLCLRSVAAGIPVLCEKPLSVAGHQTVLMIEAAERAGVLLAMASKFRFVEDVIRARGMLLSGLIDVPVLFENSFSSKVDMGHRWNSDPDVSGGGVIIDNGAHSVDLARFLFGPVTEVTALEATRLQPLTVEDTAHLLLRTASGATGHVQLSWSLEQRFDSYLCIYGIHGAVRIGWRDSWYRTGSNADWVSFGIGYDKIGAMTAQIEAFCSSLRNQEPFPVSNEDALASAEVIDAAYVSLENGRRVHIDAALAERQ